MATPCLTTDLTAWIDRLSRMLDRRIVWRLLPMLTGLLFATGRRTVSSWLRAGELSKDYQDYYYFLASLGHNVKSLASAVLQIALNVVSPQGASSLPSTTRRANATARRSKGRAFTTTRRRARRAPSSSTVMCG